MKLLHKLMQRRDEALANARKYQEMIALLEGDPSLTRGSVLRADAIADQALALHVASNGNGHGAKKKPRSIFSAAQRKKSSLRMKRLWKEKRAMMLKGVAKGAAVRIANNRRSAEA